MKSFAADEYFWQLQGDLAKAELKIDRAPALTKLGFYHRDSPDSLIRYIADLRALNTSESACVANALCAIYEAENSNISDAFQFISVAISYTDTTRREYSIGVLRFALGKVFYANCEYSKAFDMFINASYIFSEQKDRFAFASSQYMLACIMMYYNEFSEATRLIADVEKTAKEIKSDLLLNMAYLKASGIDYYVDNIALMEYHINKAYPYFKQNTHNRNFAVASNTKGILGHVIDTNRNFIDFYIALDSCKYRSDYAYNFAEIGNYYYNNKDYSAAEENYTRCINVSLRRNQKVNIAFGLQLLGELYRDEYEQLSKAAQYIDSSMRINIQLQRFIKAKLQCDELIDICKRGGDNTRLIGLLVRRGAISDSIEAQKSNTISIFSTRIDELYTAVNKAETEATRQKEQKNLYLSLSIFGVLLLIFGFGYCRQRIRSLEFNSQRLAVEHEAQDLRRLAHQQKECLQDTYRYISLAESSEKSTLKENFYDQQHELAKLIKKVSNNEEKESENGKFDVE